MPANPDRIDLEPLASAAAMAATNIHNLAVARTLERSDWIGLGRSLQQNARALIALGEAIETLAAAGWHADGAVGQRPTLPE